MTVSKEYAKLKTGTMCNSIFFVVVVVVVVVVDRDRLFLVLLHLKHSIYKYLTFQKMKIYKIHKFPLISQFRSALRFRGVGGKLRKLHVISIIVFHFYELGLILH